MARGYERIYISADDLKREPGELVREYGISYAQAHTALRRGYYWKLTDETLLNKRKYLGEWHKNRGHETKSPEQQSREEIEEENHRMFLTLQRYQVVVDRIAELDREGQRHLLEFDIKRGLAERPKPRMLRYRRGKGYSPPDD